VNCVCVLFVRMLGVTVKGMRMSLHSFGLRYHSTGKVLSFAEQAKSLVHSRISGTFSTIVPPQYHEKGMEVPLYGSIAPYIIGKDNEIILGIMKESRHCTHLTYSDLCSLVVFPYTPLSISPSSLPLPRVNITGNLKPIEDHHTPIVQSDFLTIHPGAKEYVSFYQFYTLDTNDNIDIAFYLPSNDSSEFISKSEYTNAPLDPLSKSQRSILNNINTQHTTDLHQLVKFYAELTPQSTLMYYVDQYGCNILADTTDHATSKKIWNDIRLPFPFSVWTEEECMKALMDAIRCLNEQTTPPSSSSSTKTIATKSTVSS
jgi:hypothetical protein